MHVNVGIVPITHSSSVSENLLRILMTIAARTQRVLPGTQRTSWHHRRRVGYLGLMGHAGMRSIRDTHLYCNVAPKRTEEETYVPCIYLIPTK